MNRANRNIVLILVITLYSYSSAFPLPVNDDSIFVQKVYTKLLKVVEPVDGYAWPPIIKITQDTNIRAGISDNNYNSITNLRGFKIFLSKGLLDKLVRRDENTLSFILGHELAHITLTHNSSDLNGNSKLINSAISHKQEFDSDHQGIKIAVDAGYLYKEIIKSLKKIPTSFDNISSFESLSKDHPSWSDRLSRIDSSQSGMWRSMSAFNNGVYFIGIEQWEPAIDCFKYVIKQYPLCYEAYADIGYAKLMKYIGALEPDELEDLKYAHLVTGTYYNHSASIERTIRGVDTDLWWEIIGDLNHALSLNAEQTLVKANLGLAYLVGPLSEVRFGKAAQYYSEAIELSERDTTINLLQKAAIYINSGISSYLSGTDESLVSRSYQVAEKFQEEFGELYPLNSNYILNDIRSSIFFNKAIKLSKSQNKGDKEQAIILFEEYFKISSISSPWLKTGREVYNNLSKEMNYNPDKYAGIIDSSRIDLKKIVGITINDSIRINLSDNSKMVLGQLKDYQSTETVLIPKRNLKRVKISKIGLEMIANEYIFALILNGGHSPAINLSSKSGFEKELKLYVGMKIELLNNILQNMNFKEDVHLTNSRRHYKYYYDIGLGVSLDEIHGTVAELVITNLSDK